MTSTILEQTTTFDRAGLDDAALMDLYEAMLLPRLIEEKMLLLIRQGKLSKWFSGIGQEAIAVGVTKALRSTDFILPLHRNLGVFTARDVPLHRLFSQWQGKKSPNLPSEMSISVCRWQWQLKLTEDGGGGQGEQRSS